MAAFPCTRAPRSLVPALLGQHDPLELLTAACTQSPKRSPRQLCQAHFYIGAIRLASGDRDAYQEHLGEASIAATVPVFPDCRILVAEYHLALGELRGVTAPLG